MEPLPLPIEIADVLLPGGVFDFLCLVIAVQRDAEVLVFVCFCLLDGQPFCTVFRQ